MFPKAGKPKNKVEVLKIRKYRILVADWLKGCSIMNFLL